MSKRKRLQEETPTPVFSCEYCAFLKNSFFIEHLWWLLLLSGDFLQLNLAGVDQYMQMFKIVSI